MPQPHKHAEVIKAWADGAQIQVRGNLDRTWVDIPKSETPIWHHTLEYRVKPTNPVRYAPVYRTPKMGLVVGYAVTQANLAARSVPYEHDLVDVLAIELDANTGKLVDCKSIPPAKYYF